MKDALKNVFDFDTSSVLALWLAFIGANMACLAVMAMLLVS